MDKTPNSKPIRKVDDDAKALIIEALQNDLTGGFDLDSIYKIKGVYHVIEFLKCDTVRPNDSHPKRYWFKNKQKFISLWDITTTLKGKLFLLNYEDSREQFKMMEILELDNTGIIKENVHVWNFNQFKEWFRDLNKQALNS